MVGEENNQNKTLVGPKVADRESTELSQASLAGSVDEERWDQPAADSSSATIHRGNTKTRSKRPKKKSVISAKNQAIEKAKIETSGNISDLEEISQEE